VNSDQSLERFAAAVPEPQGRFATPVFQGPPIAAYDLEPAEESIPLSHYLWVLRRHRWRILPFVLGCVICTLIVSKRLTPVYESTVTVDVDRRMPTGVIGEEAAQSTLNDTDQFLATQIRLIQSDAVLRPVAEEYHLLASDGTQEQRAQAPVALKNLHVSRPPNTYLLLISYRSPDRLLATNVANAVAQSYIEHTFDIRFRSSANLASFMEKQTEELKAKMERSSAALAQFENELNVINPTEKTNILSARLLQLNTDYTNAETDRVKKEAAYRSVSGGTLEAAQASSQGEALKRLAERLGEVREKFAETRSHYGTNHPEYRKAESQLQQLETQFEEARRGVAARVEVEYHEAINRENMLKAAVAATKAEFDSLNARSFQYDALKREAEADKKLYEELVTKIREAGINAGFQSSMVRLADSARPGWKPVFPNVPLNVGLAFLFSALISVAAAVLSDTLDRTVRDSEQVVRVAKAEALGGLPQVKEWKGRMMGAGDTGSTALVRHAGDDRAMTSFEEAIRTLRNTILLSSFDRRIRSLMVTSATPGEGKSTMALHLALAHAQQKQKTLLIDCDLRRPSIHRKVGMKGTLGLNAVLLNGLDWRAATLPVEGSPDLDVLLAGTPSRRAADIIGGRLADILEDALADYDLVIVDAPPALGFPEPLQMATVVDAVALIALAGQTDRKALGSVVSTLKKLRANVLGVVLNEITRDLGDSYYYHGYYGKYYSKYYEQTKG